MVSVAAAAFVVGIQKTSEWEVSILHLAQSAGTSVETMSGLSFAAKMMGLEISQVAQAMERFDKQLLQAQLGNAKAGQNMSMLGIDPKQIKTSDDALLLLADHFAKLPDGALKSGEAMMAFGKAGAQMIPVLNLGKKGIQDFMAQAKAMGVVVSRDQAEAAERFEQNSKRMEEALHGLSVEITNRTVPALNALTVGLLKTTQTKGLWAGFWETLGEGSAILTQGVSAYNAYAFTGKALIAQEEKMRAGVTAVTAAVAENAKAFDALKKSTGAIITSLDTQIKTFGKTAEQVQIYKINTDAAAIGQKAWAAAEVLVYDRLQKKLNLLQQLAVLKNSKKDEEEKLFLAAKLKADQDDLAVMAAQLDIAMRMPFGASVFIPAPQATNAFTASIEEQSAALEHQIATFGMSSQAIALYDLAQLDSSEAAQQQIEKFKQLQDQLAALAEQQRAAEIHARAMKDAWREFGRVADRSLNDLIFSGKKFTDVLRDITKALGEMFLKWALFGTGQQSGGGGGLFGMLFNSLFAGGFGGFFGGGMEGTGNIPFGEGQESFASGGPVSAGVPILVGEQGPEIFMPSTAGAIIPHGAGLGGPAAVVNYYIDARGSSITEEQFRRSLAVSENNAVQRALNMTREIQLRTA
jgi:hypothetical protein